MVQSAKNFASDYPPAALDRPVMRGIFVQAEVGPGRVEAGRLVESRPQHQADISSAFGRELVDLGVRAMTAYSLSACSVRLRDNFWSTASR